MRLTTSDGRFAIANFVSTFPLFCRHSSKFTCHPIFSVPDRKNRCRTSGVGCRKSESDTCKQPNINEKEGKIRCRKSAVGCRKPHTCVRTLRLNIQGPTTVKSRSRLTLIKSSNTSWTKYISCLLGAMTIWVDIEHII